MVRAMDKESAKILIVENSIPEPNSGCWIWELRTDSRGYGILRINRKPMLAHRVSYMVFNGEIRKGTHIDHICTLQCCVNPDHLEQVPPQTNWARHWGRRLFCLNGHFLGDDNIILLSSRQGVRCKRSHRERMAKYRQLQP